MSPLTVLVVEDFEQFRLSLCLTIQEKTQCQIIGEASDGLEAVRKAEEFQPDLILLDIGLPTLNGFDVAQRIRNHSPNSKILFVSQHCDPEMVQTALRLGARGYLLKSDAAELPFAIKTIFQGGQFLSSHLKIPSLVHGQAGEGMKKMGAAEPTAPHEQS